MTMSAKGPTAVRSPRSRGRGHRAGDLRRRDGACVGQAECLQLRTSATGAASAVAGLGAHLRDQTAINFYRSLVFDDQLSVLDAC